MNYDINIPNIERKDHIKYLGILLDENLNWKKQISLVNNKIAKNIGIFYKLRHFVNLQTLKQLYYCLVYPYLNYGSISWGNTYPTSLTKLFTKQNNCVRSIFYASNRESASPYYQLLHILKFDNIVRFKICSLTYKLYYQPSKVPSIFHNLLTPVTAIHTYNTRNAANLNFYRPKIRTNFGKFTFKYSATKLWEDIPLHLKQIASANIFDKSFKNHLIVMQNNPETF